MMEIELDTVRQQFQVTSSSYAMFFLPLLSPFPFRFYCLSPSSVPYNALSSLLVLNSSYLNTCFDIPYPECSSITQIPFESLSFFEHPELQEKALVEMMISSMMSVLPARRTFCSLTADVAWSWCTLLEQLTFLSATFATQQQKTWEPTCPLSSTSANFGQSRMDITRYRICLSLSLICPSIYFSVLFCLPLCRSACPYFFCLSLSLWVCVSVSIYSSPYLIFAVCICLCLMKWLCG